MESDISLSSSGLISEPALISEPSPTPAPTAGPPPLPPKRPATPTASPEPAESTATITAPAASPAAEAVAGTPAAPVPPTPPPAAGGPPEAVATQPDSASRKAASALLQPFAALVGRMRDWVVTSGVWWAASATAHALILSVALLVLGTVITPTYHSVAPTFEAGVNTVIGESDIQTFDINAGRSARGRTARRYHGHTMSGVGGGGPIGEGGGGGGSGGAAGGGWSPGEGSGRHAWRLQDSAREARGDGSPGGIKGLDSNWKKTGGKIDGGGGSIARRRAANGGVVAAGDVKSAVDGVLKGISGELEKGDLLVCWLIDASISLADDRQVIADRVEPYFRRIRRPGPQEIAPATQLRGGIQRFDLGSHQADEFQLANRRGDAEPAASDQRRGKRDVGRRSGHRAIRPQMERGHCNRRLDG